MEHFTSQFAYTDQIIEESTRFYFRRRMRIPAILLLIVFVVQILPLLASRTPSSIVAILLVLAAFVMGMLKEKSLIKTEKQRLAVLYSDEQPIMTVTVGEDITLESDDSTRSIDFSHIRYVGENSSFIIVLLKGAMFIPLKKDSFIEGTPEECFAYLKAKSRRK